MSDEQKKEAPALEQAWVLPKGGRPEIYSNIFYLHWTLTDVRIRLGMLVPSMGLAPLKATREIEEVGAIVIPWDQAKYLEQALASAVKAYEDVNGEIKPKILPKG